MSLLNSVWRRSKIGVSAWVAWVLILSALVKNFGVGKIFLASVNFLSWLEISNSEMKKDSKPSQF